MGICTSLIMWAPVFFVTMGRREPLSISSCRNRWASLGAPTVSPSVPTETFTLQLTFTVPLILQKYFATRNNRRTAPVPFNPRTSLSIPSTTCSSQVWTCGAPSARPMASRAAFVAGDYANCPRHCDRHRRCKPCQDFATAARSQVAIEPAISVKSNGGQEMATAKHCSHRDEIRSAISALFEAGLRRTDATPLGTHRVSTPGSSAVDT